MDVLGQMVLTDSRRGRWSAKTRRLTMGLFGLVAAAILAVAYIPFAHASDAKPQPPKGRVARAFFTTDVVNREPVDHVLVMSTAKTRIYFFTDLRHMQGQTVIHRWIYKGKVVATVRFQVKGPRWRVYSSKDLSPNQLGKWTVVVTNGKGWPLKAGIFRYVAAGGKGANAPIILPPNVDAGE